MCISDHYLSPWELEGRRGALMATSRPGRRDGERGDREWRREITHTLTHHHPPPTRSDLFWTSPLIGPRAPAPPTPPWGPKGMHTVVHHHLDSSPMVHPWTCVAAYLYYNPGSVLVSIFNVFVLMFRKVPPAHRNVPFLGLMIISTHSSPSSSNPQGSTPGGYRAHKGLSLMMKS